MRWCQGFERTVPKLCQVDIVMVNEGKTNGWKDGKEWIVSRSNVSKAAELGFPKFEFINARDKSKGS